MARSRNIKPSFFTNDQLSECSFIERLAFIGLWTVSDFKGCIEFRPKMLKVQLFPYDNCDFEKIAINLERSGLIRNYSAQGKRYIKIINFTKHQNPHKNEREAGSSIPDFDELLVNESQDVDLKELEINRDKDGTTRDKDGTARADSLLLIPDSLLLIPDKKDIVQGCTPKTKVLVPYDEIISVYHEILPSLAQVYKLSDTRKRHIKKLWMEELEDIESWRNYFIHVSRSDFLMGKVSDKSVRPFVATIDFIINPTNFIKIAEDKYHEKKVQQRRAYL